MLISGEADFDVTAQFPLFLLNNYSVLDRSLPIGSYIFYFGVDMDMNGHLDMGDTYYDSVYVSVMADD